MWRNEVSSTFVVGEKEGENRVLVLGVDAHLHSTGEIGQFVDESLQSTLRKPLAYFLTLCASTYELAISVSLEF
jgi:hypothetical protein